LHQAIETAPRDGSAIILEDDASGTYDVAHWSPEAGQWVGENGEPIKLTPSRWYRMPRDKYLLEEDEGSSKPSRAGPSASGARRYSFFPFSLRRAAPQTTSDVVASGSIALVAPMTAAALEGPTAPSEAKGRPQARRGFATSSIVATLVAAALIGVYLFAEVAPYVMRHAVPREIFGVAAIGEQVVGKEAQSPRQDSWKTGLLALQQQAEADQASAVEASVPEPQESLDKEQGAEALTNKLAEAGRIIDGLNLQLRTEAATAAQLIEQEREKTAARVQEATAARQELAASTGQHRQAVEEERVRGVALARELEITRREIEANAALLNKARDDVAQFKQTAEKTTAELQQERERAEASSRELAIARREIETNAALLNKAREDVAQFKQTAEKTTAELQQERDSKNAMSRELAMARESARRTMDGRVTLERAANNQIAQVTQAVGAAAPERPADAEAQGNPEATRLIARAKALLGQGNIAAARIVLERAAETGSAQASFTLAETYDPVILSTWGTQGTRGDATKARELYTKAYAGGIQEAKNRFDALEN
jgi:hypothetical protein